MNKQQLIDAMAKETGLTKTDSKKALDAFVNITMQTMVNNEKISLVGFGSFAVTDRAARKGRNPKTGEEIHIAAKKVVRFKPGSNLTDTVN